ncbi:MAG TPA: hypothetical protein VL400_27210, partial [Polyangiaceae bacterium]|nr:hypothetical protein [Polyangiaceae bacterium]
SCLIATTCDGTRRCVPRNAFGFVDDKFADSSCAEPAVALTRGDCDLPLPDTLMSTSADCADGPRFYHRGEELVEVYERDVDAPDALSCVLAQPPKNGWRYYRVGEPIALETFPALVERVE